MDVLSKEWFYKELLELLKEKEQDENGIYQQIQLELPLIDPQQIEISDGNKIDENENKDRGVIIIDL